MRPIAARLLAAPLIAAALAACSGEPARSEGEEPPPLSVAGPTRAPSRSAATVSPSASSRPGEKRTGGAAAKTVRAPAAASGKKAAEKPAAGDPAPAAKAAGEPARPSTRRTPPAERSGGAPGKIVEALLADLNSEDPRRPEAAFWRLAEIGKEFIPELISAVERTDKTKLSRLTVLVMDSEFIGDGKLFLASRIQGLGRMEVLEGEGDDLHIRSKEYTDISYGITKNKRYKVVIDRADGFPLGIVIRAGLINRFRTSRHPTMTDDDPASGKLIAWWRAFYAQERERL